MTSLSGFAELADGEIALFAIVVNGYGQGARAAMDGVDAFVAELIKHGGALDADAKRTTRVEATPETGAIWGGVQELEARVTFEPAS